MATGFTLQDALTALGVVRVFVSDPDDYDTLVALPTEGDVSVVAPQNLNELTAPELTGDVPHDAWVTTGKVTATVPVIYTGADQLRLFSATGTASVGVGYPQRPVFRRLFIVPLIEMDTTNPEAPEISYDGSTWTPQAPTNSIMLWRVVPVYPEITSSWNNGGKIIVPVTFNAFFDATRTSGHNVMTIGNPADYGMTDFVV